ncbi:LacI family DNA-binding transcriptional regulator [Glaciibacter sp. 2TAF33]|uniref:LacI family DNA-binding transcriptional regulator n=1 Tax=Glaciibacter sp. 2TAF33 TaxID=3233015 RepID=UPI003F93080F
MNALADVARAAGVSKATASRALSGRGYVSTDARDRVVAAASAIGYVASPNAASLVTGQTFNVGVVIPFINKWFFGEVLEGAERALLDCGYDLTLYNLTDDPDDRDRIFDFFLARKRFDAVIVIGVEPHVSRVWSPLRLGKPVIGIGAAPDGIRSVSIDDVAAGALAADHLLRLGHTEIVFLGGDGDEGDEWLGSVHGRRLSGFTSALRAAGVPAADRHWPAEISLPGGMDAALRLLGDPRYRPTAIFAGSDEVAIGVIIAARQLGILVPAELSVIGIDGHDYAPMFGLTTIEQHPRDQGRRAVEILMGELGASAAVPNEPGAEIMPVRLVTRSSTSAPGLRSGEIV